MRVERFFIGFFLILFFSGCSIKEVEKRPTEYRLTPNIQKYITVKPINKTLKIQALSGGDLADTKAIFYAQDDLVLPYKYARWSEVPSLKLQQILRETLSKQKIFKGVVDSHSYALADILLEGRLLHFEQVYKEDNSSFIHVKIRLNLVKRKEALLIASKVFSSQVMVSSESTKGSIKTFNTAIENILKKISEWIYEQTKY